MSLSQVRIGRIPNYLKEFVPKNQNYSEQSFKISKNKFCLLLKYMRKQHKFDKQFLCELTKYLPNNLYTRMYLNYSSHNQLILLCSIRDKAYQIFQQNANDFYDHQIKARKLIISNYKSINVEKDSDLALYLKIKYTIQMKRHAFSMIQFIKQIPGFESLDKKDIQVVIKESFFSVFALRTVNLFINNDYYLMLGDIPMTRDIFSMIKNEKIRDCFFEFYENLQKLNLTNEEYCLIIPIVLTMTGNYFQSNKIFILHKFIK